MKTSNKIFLSLILAAFVFVIINVIVFRFMVNPDVMLDSDNFSFFHADKTVIGDGKIIEKAVNVTPFNSLNVNGRFDIDIHSGSKNSVSVSTDANILPYLKVVVSDNKLNIGIPSNIYALPTKMQRIHIVAKDLHDINLSGKTILQAVDMNTNSITLNMSGKSVGKLQGDIKQVRINLSGKSNLQVELKNSETINLTIVGKGKVSLVGSVKNINIIASGHAMVIASDLKSDHVMIQGTGHSDMTVRAVKSLSIMTAGNSHVKYYGDPKVSQNISGHSLIEKN